VISRITMVQVLLTHVGHALQRKLQRWLKRFLSLKRKVNSRESWVVRVETINWSLGYNG
jgi:hypothetical protein